jgi:hypothetical protein
VLVIFGMLQADQNSPRPDALMEGTRGEAKHRGAH